MIKNTIEILSGRATGKKHKYKVNKGNKSVMYTMNEQVNIVSELDKYVTRMKIQLCAPAA